MTITAIRGFNDILPEETGIWRQMEAAAFRIFSSYGFAEIKTPVAERTELFLRSIGETTDIVEKEMYTFADRRGDSLTLRPEGTAPAVRAYIEHKLYAAPVTRLYYTGPMFRYERPQKGRYRQFYQIGAEVLGEPSPMADAETLSMLMRFFKEIGLESVALQINSLGCVECRPGYKEKLIGYLRGVELSLCENCRRRMDANPLRALDCKNPGCIEATAKAPSIIEALCTDCSAHFGAVRASLSLYGIDAPVNPRMVRGLDYYTKTTFEITAVGLGSQNSVAAGGRYDSLVKDLGGPETPCFGFAIGIERVAMLMKEKGIVIAPLTVFIPMGPEAEEKGASLLSVWRERGLRVVQDFTSGSLKSRMKRADRLGARYAAILGTDELNAGMITIKDLKTASQETYAFEVAADRLSV